ncbi:hypothetical protein EXIGLDRAFT_722423 [Exidia glandulosa HHB12029]|uniref:Uncharacterized protein n=1 Tax=Exidia glandulosa HHB12029 TaxID=1314781 RepID=A0A165FAV8_EXIGL|nr:hypothetical protein EXIGLDRAFT_722423 [Exidia glandulosa HHB12029]
MLPSLFVTLLALAAAPLAVVAKGIQPPASFVRPRPSRVSHNSRDITAERMTNAKRMAQGLPPLPPRMHRRGTQTAAKARPSPSGVPGGHATTGYIMATETRTGKFVGFVGKQYELFGEYGAVASTRNALKVKITGLKKHATTGPIEIHQTNGDKLFTSFGAVAGFASDSATLAPGSSNYLYIAGASSTAPLAAAIEADNSFTEATGQEEAAESAIWFIDSVKNKISAKWVNPDGSVAKTQLAYYPDDNVFIAVGDAKAFTEEFGKAVPVTFTLVGH